MSEIFVSREVENLPLYLQKVIYRGDENLVVSEGGVLIQDEKRRIYDLHGIICKFFDKDTHENGFTQVLGYDLLQRFHKKLEEELLKLGVRLRLLDVFAYSQNSIFLAKFPSSYKLPFGLSDERVIKASELLKSMLVEMDVNVFKRYDLAFYIRGEICDVIIFDVQPKLSNLNYQELLEGLIKPQLQTLNFQKCS